MKEPSTTTSLTGFWYETLAAEPSTDTAGIFIVGVGVGVGVAETAAEEAEAAAPEDDEAEEVHPATNITTAPHPDTTAAPACHLRRPGICLTAMTDTMPHPIGSLRPARAT